MELLDHKQEASIANVIKQRRTVRLFKDTPVSQELIVELLNVAIWAPNHENRQPWRFILVQGEGRKTFAEAMVRTYSSEDREKYGVKKQEYLENVPVHLIVVLKEDPRPKVWEEDYAAACSLIQNFQLAAWEHGLGVVWKTNHYGYDPRFRASVGVQSGEKIVGVLHIGYPKVIPEAQSRIPAEQLLSFMDN